MGSIAQQTYMKLRACYSYILSYSISCILSYILHPKGCRKGVAGSLSRRMGLRAANSRCRALLLPSALFSAVIAVILPLELNGRTEEAICFEVLDKKELVCVDFSRQWYVAYPLRDYILLLLRDPGTKAPKHVWNAGRYALTHKNWENVKTALATRGQTESCPHPEYRLSRDHAKPRREFCAARSKPANPPPAPADKKK